MIPVCSIRARSPSNVSVQSASASITKLTPAKKRVSRACDECRLHKARCNGAASCETCHRYNRVCSYNLLPVECKGSAARIRILEHRLVKARECIGQLQKQLPQDVAAHVHNSLAPQPQPQSQPQPQLPLPLPPPNPIASQSGLMAATSSPSTVSSLLSSPGLTQAHSIGLGLSLIETLLQPLSANGQMRSLIDSKLARSMLCDTGPPNDHPSTRFCQLPPYNTMIEVVYAAFNSVFALCNVLTEQEFRISTQRLYDIHPVSYSPEDAEFVPLFCIVIALGMIHCSKIHQELGYEDVLKESLLYFEAASTSIANNQECATVPKLQTTLCLVLYLINTSQLDLARPALRIICASRMVEDLFRSFSTSGRASSQTSPSTPSIFSSLSDMRRKDIVWSIVYLDMHVSGLLRVPPLLHDPGPELATVHAVNTAAHNVANYKRSDTTFLLSVSLAMAIELMKLIRQISSTTPVTTPNSNAFPTPPSSDALEWTDLRGEFDTWEFILRSVFAENDCNPILCLVRHQLQCHLYLAQIILYLPYLCQHAEPPAMKSPSQIDNIHKGRACVTAATNAIMYTSMYREQTQVTALSWHSAYVVFISLLTLLVATSFTDGLGRHTLQHTIHVAVQTLSTSTHGSSRSKSSYLEFAQAVSTNLRPPFKIETARRSSFSSDASTVFSPRNTRSTKMSMSSQDTSLSPDGSGASGSNLADKQWWLPMKKEHSQDPPDQWDFDPS